MKTKKIISVLAVCFTMMLGVQPINAQDPNYIMTIELNNGTKMKLNTNDVKEITFLDGKLVVTGGSLADRIDSLAKVCYDNYDFLYALIKEIHYDVYVDIDKLKDRILLLENRIDSLISSQGGTNDQEGTLSTNIIGTWLVTASDYSDYPDNSKITFNSDGTASYGYTYKVDGDTLEMDYLGSDGTIKVATKGTYAISGKEATYTFIQYEKGKWWEENIHTLKATKQ